MAAHMCWPQAASHTCEQLCRRRAGCTAGNEHVAHLPRYEEVPPRHPASRVGFGCCFSARAEVQVWKKKTVSGTTSEIPLSGNALQNSHLSIKSSLQDWHGRAKKHQQQHCWKLGCPQDTAPMTILAWHPAQKHHCFIPPNQKSV